MNKKNSFWSVKNILSALIIVVGLIMSFLIISPPNEGGAGSVIEKTISGNPSLQYKSGAVSGLTGSTKILLEELNTNDQNLTDNLAKLYAASVVNRDSEELKLPFDDSDLGNELDRYLSEESLKQFEVSEITTNDITITKNGSKENQLSYVVKVKEISENNFGSLRKTEVEMLEGWLKNQETEGMRQFANAIKKQLADLLNQPVPESWSEIHLRVINLLRLKLVAYRALMDYSRDPLKALIGFQIASELVVETLDVQKTFEEKYLALNNNE